MTDPNRVLVADDDSLSRQLLERNLSQWGYTSVHVEDGEAALAILEGEDAPSLAILDWVMPKLDGTQVCARVRELVDRPYIYLILLTAKNKRADITQGLLAGADDYLRKPFDALELQARLLVGQRMVELERTLAHKVKDLEKALADVRTLKTLLPICTYCKAVRDDQDYWHAIDAYVHQQTGANFSHGICPACMSKIETGELDF